MLSASGSATVALAVDAPEPLPEPQLDHQEDPSPALLAARRAVESFETIASAGPLPEPMRTQMIECFRMSYEAAIERVAAKMSREILDAMLNDRPVTLPEEELDPSALNVQPLNPEGVALAGQLGVTDEGGFRFSR